MRRIVQISNVWSPADDDKSLDAMDLVFVLDDEGMIWKGEIDARPSDCWRRLEAVPPPHRITQISASSAPRDSRLDSVVMERVFALCDDGSVWLKLMPLLRDEQPWIRLAEIPQQKIVQISTAWAGCQGSKTGFALAPLADSVDRLFALCNDGSFWIYHPYAYWCGDDTNELPHWDRLPGLPPDP